MARVETTTRTTEQTTDRSCGQCLGNFLVDWHLWPSLNIGLAYGFFAGLLHLLSPFVTPFLAFALLLWSGAFLPWLLATGLAVLFVGGLTLDFLHERNPHWPLPKIIMAALIWWPLVTGEIASSAAIRSALHEAKPIKYQTQSLLVSMHEHGVLPRPGRNPHAWMIKTDGSCHTWSYREMRFVMRQGDFLCR
ncbi:MAG: hypothetical protein Q4G62_06665 [Pseudomonadota bacterium]|nr:hypothetical protein [Pseudomonadota bacterium]